MSEFQEMIAKVLENNETLYIPGGEEDESTDCE